MHRPRFLIVDIGYICLNVSRTDELVRSLIMNEQDLMNFDDVALVENQSPRCPLLLVIDSSSSMFVKREGETTSPMEGLNAGLDYLVSELYGDNLSKNRISLSTVVYGSEVEPPTPFAEVENLVLPALDRGLGVTSTGKALNVALDHLDDYKKKLDGQGIQRYKAFVFLLSDGLSTDELSEASKRIKEGEEKGKFAFFAIGIDGADTEQLSSIGHRPAMELKPDSFKGFFEWVSASAASVSSSQPGDAVALPKPQEYDWTTF